MWKLRSHALEAPHVIKSEDGICEAPIDLSSVETEVVNAPSLTSSEEIAEVS
jgi:hypothetical protein